MLLGLDYTSDFFSPFTLFTFSLNTNINTNTCTLSRIGDACHRLRMVLLHSLVENQSSLTTTDFACGVVSYVQQYSHDKNGVIAP